MKWIVLLSAMLAGCILSDNDPSDIQMVHNIMVEICDCSDYEVVETTHEQRYALKKNWEKGIFLIVAYDGMQDTLIYFNSSESTVAPACNRYSDWMESKSPGICSEKPL